MPEWIGTLLVALAGGGIAAIGTWIINWRKTKPEIAKMYEEMATKQAKQINEMRDRVNRQDRKIQRQGAIIIELRKCLREWEQGIRMLVEQIMSNGMTPVWTPKLVEDLEDEEKE